MNAKITIGSCKSYEGKEAVDGLPEESPNL